MGELIAEKARVCGGGAFDIWEAICEQFGTPGLRPRGNPEGKREYFEKWVMATNHPVFGFLDGRSLARGDDRTGYADEYVQGLWVAYLALGVEQPAPIALASREESIAWLKRIDGIGQARAELIYSMGFRRHTEVPQS